MTCEIFQYSFIKAEHRTGDNEDQTFIKTFLLLLKDLFKIYHRKEMLSRLCKIRNSLTECSNRTKRKFPGL